MTGSRKYVDAALRTSREIAACIGRIQNPRASLSQREQMSAKFHAIRYHIQEFVPEITDNVSALTGGSSEPQSSVEDARVRLLGEPMNQIEVWAIQHASHFNGTAPLADSTTMMLVGADEWHDRAYAACADGSADREVLRALRRQANATFIGVGLASLATSFSGTVADDLHLLARATLIAETDDGATPSP